jgi:copper chaperone
MCEILPDGGFQAGEEVSRHKGGICMSKMESISMKVTGMSCAHCEKRVSTALLRLDGVKEASASAKAEEAKVTFDTDKLGIEQIKEAIQECGYTPAGAPNSTPAHPNNF